MARVVFLHNMPIPRWYWISKIHTMSPNIRMTIPRHFCLVQCLAIARLKLPPRTFFVMIVQYLMACLMALSRRFSQTAPTMLVVLFMVTCMELVFSLQSMGLCIQVHSRKTKDTAIMSWFTRIDTIVHDHTHHDEVSLQSRHVISFIKDPA